MKTREDSQAGLPPAGLGTDGGPIEETLGRRAAEAGPLPPAVRGPVPGRVGPGTAAPFPDSPLDGNGAAQSPEGVARLRTAAPSGSTRKAEDWGVYVNECGIFATRIGAGKWAEFLLNTQRLGTDGRLTMLSASPGGCEWHLMCGTKEAAAEAREIFTEQGIHQGHVKVARLSACRAKAAERKRRFDGRTVEIEAEIEAAG